MKSTLTQTSLIKAFQLVDCFCGPTHKYTLTELAKKMNISIGSAQRITHTLMSLGYLSKDSRTKEYRLGPKWLTIGFAFLSEIDLRRIVLPHLKELNELTKEDICFGIRDGDRVLYIERLQTPYMLTTHARPGLSIPVYSTSIGRVIWAFLQDDESERIFNSFFSGNEISDKKRERIKIENELNKIRKMGYSVKWSNEFGEGVFAIAVPIMNHEGLPFAGMNIAIPLSRLSEKKVYKEYLPRLIEKGKLISLELGNGSSV